MIRIIKEAKSIEDIRKKISDTLYDYIKYDLWRMPEDYYKQIKKQFTVNGRKYIVKNDSKHRLHILNPEGTDLYGYRIPSHLYGFNPTDDMALSILNDAYGDSLDKSMKKVFIHYHPRCGYTPDYNDYDYFEKYVKALKSDTQDGSSGRYAVLTIDCWGVSLNYGANKSNVTWKDDKNEAIKLAKDFLKEASKSNKERTWYASVFDSEIGEDVYWDKLKTKHIEEEN